MMGAGNFLEDSVLNPGPTAIPANVHRPYRPKINMWPAASDALLTTVTVNSAKSHLLLQSDPQTWEAGLPPRELLSAPRVPFARVCCGHIMHTWSHHRFVSRITVQTSHLNRSMLAKQTEPSPDPGVLIWAF